MKDLLQVLILVLIIITVLSLTACDFGNDRNKNIRDDTTVTEQPGNEIQVIKYENGEYSGEVDANGVE